MISSADGCSASAIFLSLQSALPLAVVLLEQGPREIKRIDEPPEQTASPALTPYLSRHAPDIAEAITP
jgi:hypothetical protein